MKLYPRLISLFSLLTLFSFCINAVQAQTGTCTSPENIYASKITSSSVRLNWTPESAAIGYTIFIRPLGGTLYSFDVAGGSARFLRLENFPANQNFEWTVISYCTPGVYSVITHRDTFHTLPFEYSVDLENSNCDAAASGSFDLSISGTSTYSFLWSTGDDEAFIDDLAPGSYSVDISDDNNSGAAVSLDLLVHEAFEEREQLLPVNGNANAEFGDAVDINGNWVIVGAYRDDANGANAGAAYFYQYDGSGWVQTQKVSASDASAGALFGISVAIQGNRAIIGAEGEASQGSNAGAAYVFDYNGSTWVQTSKLVASDGAADDAFGNSVSITANQIAVAAYQDDDNGGSSGAVYLFEFSGSNWLETQKLTGPGGSRFGKDIAMDSTRLLVGAYLDLGSVTGGAAYLYTFDGSSWTFDQKIESIDDSGFDRFGWAVDISGDYMIIGAPFSDKFSYNAGAAYIFKDNGVQWTEVAITRGSGAYETRYGYDVSISGNRCIVGNPFHYSGTTTGEGLAYIVDFNGVNWETTQSFVTPYSGYLNLFSHAVAIDGDHLVAGMPGDDNLNGNNAGNAIIYSVCSTPIPCSTPTASPATDVSWVTATANWSPVPNAEGFEVSISALGDTTTTHIYFPGGSRTSGGLKFLDINTTYVWKVRSVCSTVFQNVSNYSATDTFTTLLCATPASAFTSSVDSTSAVLNWSSIPGIAGYRVTGGVLGGPFIHFNIASSSGNTLNVSNLVPGTTYEWSVKTICSSGALSASTTPVVFTTPTMSSAKANHFDPEPLDMLRLDVFPNPSSGSVRLLFNQDIDASDIKFTLFNAGGDQLILDPVFSNGRMVTLDLSDQSSGIYQIVVQGKNIQAVKKLVLTGS